MGVGFTSCGSNAPVELPRTGSSMEGEVQYDGKTLGFGIVIVEGAGTSVQGNISQDGTYKVDNVPVGPVKLAVVTNPGMARAAQMAAGSNQGPGAKGKGKLGKVPENVDVPVKYHTTNSSNMSYTIEKGTNKYDIVIPK
jgi:hypothetical protein